MANPDERTTEILRRFHQSWIETENFYSNLIEKHEGWERLKPLLHFIRKLKSNGENNFFRIGTSMFILIFSRSVAHGLRPDQKQIKIDAINNGDFEITLKDGGTTYRQYRINSLDDVRLSKLLDTLKHMLAD